MTRYKNNNKRRAKAPAKAIQKNKEKVRPPFRIIPLGGMKEIGKNCTLIECNDEILIIDCGLAFPEYEMFGIDIVIPDFTYLKENIEKVATSENIEKAKGLASDLLGMVSGKDKK